jgi:hypothetical protein
MQDTVAFVTQLRQAMKDTVPYAAHRLKVSEKLRVQLEGNPIHVPGENAIRVQLYRD